MKISGLIKAALIVGFGTFGLVSSAAAVPVFGQISVGGYAQAVGSLGMGDATGISFASGNPPTITGSGGGLYSYGAGTGSFASLGVCASSIGACGTIQNVADFSSQGAAPAFLTLNTGGPAVSFDLSSITDVGHATDLTGGSVTFTADGIINFAGFDSTAGQFILTAQGNNIVSFSATTVATPGNDASTTPLPGALPMFASALGLGGLFYRRKKKA